jgi:hypothetical protein
MRITTVLPESHFPANTFVLSAEGTKTTGAVLSGYCTVRVRFCVWVLLPDVAVMTRV